MVARAVAALLWVLLSLPAFGQEVRVELEPPRLQVGQTGRMNVLVIGTQTRGAPQLQAPDGVVLEFDQSYRRMVRAGFDNVLVYFYRYRVTALAEGTFEIGGWEVPLRDGSTLLSGTAELTVVPRQSIAFEELDLTAGFRVDQAWEGQVVIYDYELKTRVETVGQDWRLPPFEGFRTTDTGTPQQRNFAIEDPSGGEIHIVGGAIPLVVTGTGDLTQPGALVSVRVPVGQPGFLGLQQYKPERVVARPSTLISRALPPAPPNFSGLVGDFEVRSRLDKTRAAVGESVTWTLEIAGDGNLDGWRPPELEDFAGITVYDSDGTVEAWVRDSGYAARGRFPRVLVPSESGTIDLPSVELVVFSPTKGDYVTTRLNLGSLVVTEGREQGGSVESFGQLPEPGEVDPVDFRGIYTWGTGWHLPVARVAPMASGALALPAFVVLLLAGIERLRDRLAARRAALERPPTPAERLARLPEDRLLRLAALDGALRQALADRLGTTVAELDRDRALGELDEALRERVQPVWRRLDRARFAQGPSDGLEDGVRSAVAALAEASP